MTSVWFAASGSGEDGDPWDVRDVFATQELAEAYCNRHDKPAWEHPYVQEWEVTGSLLTKKERKAIAFAAQHFGAFKNQAATLLGILERLK